MKNILVPIGHRKSALNTLNYAIDFAKCFDAKIYLVHVFSSTRVSGSFLNIDQLMLEESNKILQEYLEKVDRKGVEIYSASLKGYDILDSLKMIIDNYNIDLIISSAKNDDSDKTYFIGKITGALIKDTATPIIVVPKKSKFGAINKILMTLKSGSIKSVTTLDPLISIQKKFNTEINLLQVKTPMFNEQDNELNETLESIIKERISTRNATVFQGVLEYLHEEAPDMLCVIRRKRGFFAKLWEQDRVKKIDFEATIPLLILKGIA